jgi:hypothetical protein
LTEIVELPVAPVDLASASLADVENYIAPRLRGFVEAGYALMAVRERRLYLNAGFDTFETYCKQRWGIDDSRARRMCDAAQVAHIAAGSSTNAPIGASVESEYQARELAPLLGKPAELREVWRKTVELAERTGAPVTASTIRQVRREHQASQSPPPVPAPPLPPKPAPAVPPAAQRVFLVITQAAEEARMLGGAEVFSGEISAEVRLAWADQLAVAARFIVGLEEACRAL